MGKSTIAWTVFRYSVGAFLLGNLPGCLATRGWVQEQLTPVDARLSNVEGRMSDTENHLTRVEAKADKALTSLDHLRLTRRFVLSLRDGATFATNSDTLTPEARQQIDGFLSDLGQADSLIFMVTGHTDSSGSEQQNYELGQQRAASVARYLTTRKGVDPLHVTTMSYGANTPIAKNTTSAGRQKNRRIEILVYKEAIASESSETNAAAY